MSASKEHFGLGGRSGWRDASRALRCPVCGHDSWCQIGAGAHAGTVLCKRVESAREKSNRDGVVFWVHTWDAANSLTECASVLVQSRAVADAATLHEAYRAVLGALRLCEGDRAALLHRGLSAERIARGQYRSLEVTGRAALARAVAHAVGSDELASVPGIAWEARDGRGWWTLKGAAGMVIPSRDSLGRIVGLKVRSMSAEGSRYTSVSSRRWGGPSSVCNVHVPVGVALGEGVLWITEGELKADTVHALMGWSIVGLAGVSLWRGAVALVERVRPSRVVVALDADWRTNAMVRTARADLVRTIAAKGIAVHAADWPIEQGKGIDDYLHGLRAARAAA